MKTSGFRCETKFGLLVFLGHPTIQHVTTPILQRGSNELGCFGDSDERETCAEESCPVWTEWSDWTDCPVTCGGGVQVGTEA